MGNFLQPQQTPRYNMLNQSLGGSTSNYLRQGREAALTRSWHVQKNFQQIYLSFIVMQSLLPIFVINK